VDKVNVNLDMLGALVMNRIGHHVDYTHIVAINDTVAGCGALGVGTTAPVSIRVCYQRVDGASADVKSEGEGALHIAKNPLDLCEMRLAGIMHGETDLLNRVHQVEAGQCQVLKGTSKTPIEGGVGNGGAVRSRQLGTTRVMVE
jgi:uncharacterized protein (DUF1501 family)